METLRLLSSGPSEYAKELKKSLFNANVIIRQLLFMESFVEDLLNLHMIMSGKFELEEK